MKISSPKDPMKLGYYLVALVDVLNQKEKIAEIGGLPRTDEERKKFLAALKATFGTVDAFRMIFEEFYAEFSREKYFPATMSEEQKATFRQLTKCEVKFQRFADTAILYVPLFETEANQFPMKGVYGVLLACAAAMKVFLAGRHILRGGIEIGLAAEMYSDQNEIYGPALYEAYRLENEVAQYPRIVIGNELVNFLMQYSHTADSSAVHPSTKVAAGIANYCLELISQDIDGYPILDYLGKGVYRALNRINTAEEIDRIQEFLYEQTERWKREKNTKLAFRYTLLLTYFLSRADIWRKSRPITK